MGPSSASSAAEPRKEDWIGRQFRRVFDDVINEPLPDDLLSLLEQLKDEDEPPPSARRR